MPDRSVTHATFAIERRYDQPPAKIFAAFSDAVAKRRWFAEGENFQVDEYTMDFRVGGLERGRFRFKGGPAITNDTTYLDIVPDERIIVAYEMTIDGRRISASLATTEFKSDGAGTRLVYTEQGAFLDGLDQPKQREEGCRGLLEALAGELKRETAT